MKLQIDTGAKSIKIEENVKFPKLIDTLKKLFPNNEWKEVWSVNGSFAKIGKKKENIYLIREYKVCKKLND